MTQEEFNLNAAYLEENGCFVSSNVCGNMPMSAEVYFNTPSGGDFSVDVEELTKEEVLNYLRGYDVSAETCLWWNAEKKPFSNIRELYNDIDEWRKNFIEIAEKMPY